MDIRSLQSFVALASTLNFTRAAELLYISQPALSKQIVNLEDELGVPLFKRNKRGVELTVYGKVFLNDAKEMIKQWGKSVSHIEQIKYGDNGFLQIGFIRDFPIKILPEAVKTFTKENPYVNIKLHEFSENECIDALCKGDVDAAFTFWEGFNSEEFNFLIINKNPICVAMHKNHHLAEKEQISILELSNEKFVAFSPDVTIAGFNSITMQCMEHSFYPNIVAYVNVVTSLFMLITSYGGVALLPESAKLIAPEDIVFIPTINEKSWVDTAFVWNKINNNLCLNKFINCIKKLSTE